MAELNESWRRAWQAAGARGDGQVLRDSIIARHEEPHRAYHTLQHLRECLAWFDRLRGLAEHPAEVELALWFHDAIYDVRRHDNEERSAELARESLEAADVDRAVAARVAALVLATRHSAVPGGRDEQVLVDIDLAILGAEPTRFAEYDSQIRQEYAFVPADTYRIKRREVLQSFLERPRGAPVTYPYGERQYSARDPSGHVWTFSQSVADMDPAAWGGELIGPA